MKIGSQEGRPLASAAEQEAILSDKVISKLVALCDWASGTARSPLTVKLTGRAS